MRPLIKDLFEPVPGGVTLVITVGNGLRSDDGAGPYIAAKAAEPHPGVALLDAGDKPENVLDKAVSFKPARTIIIDAADFGGQPGDIRLLPEDAIPSNTLTTHTFPLPVVAKMIAEDTGSEIFFIGIQPKSMAFGEGLSDEVRAAADLIVQYISA
ncbi:MAG: hydrogenase 3 maturation endopeptidase HyCI [Nitrospirae bacterium]|nr:MAG: hydrogenase 3 maturation endopeptidase HyCI [Nitrospirota bacterium]